MTTIIVEGTVAPWLWAYDHWVSGPLIDPGIFAPVGTSLTGMPIEVVWNSDPTITAAITINGVTVTLGPSTGFYEPYAQVRMDYQNITVATFSPYNSLPGNIAVNSYDPVYAALHNPHGIGGSMELIGPDGSCNSGTFSPSTYTGYPASSCVSALNGYFYVTSMVDPPLHAPGPIVGSGLPAVLVLMVFIWVIRRRRACQTKG